MVFFSALLSVFGLTGAQLYPRHPGAISKHIKNKSYWGPTDYDNLDNDEEEENPPSSFSSRAEENIAILRRSPNILSPERCQKHPRICDGIRAAMARIKGAGSGVGAGAGAGMGMSRR